MSMFPIIILYTLNKEMSQRVSAFMEATTTIRHCEDGAQLQAAVQQADPIVILFDLISNDAMSLLGKIRTNTPDSAIVALGLPGSDTFLEAEEMGVFACEASDLSRKRLQLTITQAQNQVDLIRENRLLSKRLQEQQPRHNQDSIPPPAAPSPLHLARIFRHFDNIPAVCESIVENIAEQTKVTRVGLFARGREDNEYTLRAGLKCLEESRALKVPLDSPLVRWLDVQAHIVSRSMLPHITKPSEEVLLKQALDAMGAEILIPLHGRSRMIGWLALGHRATGVPLSTREIEDLSILGEQASMTLEHSQLFEDAALQRTLIETILHSIPVGIVAVDAEGIVRGFNSSAERILEISADDVMQGPMSRIGTQLADLLTRSMRGDAESESAEWTNHINQRSVSAAVHKLHGHSEQMGAVAIIHDATREQLLREKQDHLERTAFWTELAAAISHEVRNPLVAISTFAQLLPERYDDEEFRNQFRDLATSEIGRLDRMVRQINAFANPPALQFTKLVMDEVITQAVENAKQQLNFSEIDIEMRVATNTPSIYGDARSITESLTHLLSNSLEALQGHSSPRVIVSAEAGGSGDRTDESVVIRIDDNAAGIKSDIREKIFSPFCTTKARGIGLGMPIVQRTLIDHNGHINISTGPKGTIITLVFPAFDKAGN